MSRKNHQSDSSSHLTLYAKKIRDLRTDHDLTQTQVADLLHVGQRTYADYELGRIRIPVDSLLILAEYYDTDMNFICGLSTINRGFPRNNKN